MADQRRTRRAALGVGLFAVAMVGVGSPTQAQRFSTAFSPATVPVSLVSFAPSNSASPSGSGKLVAFVGAPQADDGRTSSVWLSNREQGTLTELTVPKDGIRVGNSVHPVLSADGCAVLVTTEMAFDLFRDDDHGLRWDVYRATLPECGGVLGDWALVSTHVNADGLAQARGDVDPTTPPAISSSGSVVAYVRPYESRSGVEDAAFLPSAVDVVDLTVPVDDPQHVTAAPGLPSEAAGTPIKYVGQTSPALSADGTMVAFVSDATSDQAVADWVLPTSVGASIPTQVFVWNRNDGDPYTAVEMISVGDSGPGNNSSTGPVLSADARTVAFSSAATNLVSNDSIVACANLCSAQIYVVERDTDGDLIYDEADGRTVRVISATPETADQPAVVGNGRSFAPTITGDGTTVVFVSKASNLLTMQAPGGGGVSDGDLMLVDLSRNELRRVFDGPVPVAAAHSRPRLSANGRLLVADSLVADRLLSNPAVLGRNVVAVSFAPSLSISHLDVGTNLVGVTGAEWRLNVINQGPGSFLPVIVETDLPEQFVVSGGSCFDRAPVPAGQYCEVKLVLIPKQPGPIRATLTVAEVGYGAITLTAPLRGAGGDPTFNAFPAAADVGTSIVGQRSAAPAVFDIRNMGFTDSAVASIDVAGANPDDFDVTANGCQSVLTFLAQCQVEISFTPSAAGRRTASVNFRSPVGQYTSVLVSGHGYYEASMIASESARPGDRIFLGLEGFPARSVVVVGWSDGSGTTMVVVTDENGRVLVDDFRVRQSAKPGDAVLVAQVPGGPSAFTTVEIERIRDRRRS